MDDRDGGGCVSKRAASRGRPNSVDDGSDKDGGGCVSKRAASRGRLVRGRANSMDDRSDKDGGRRVSKQVASLGRPARGSGFVELLPVVVQYEGVQSPWMIDGSGCADSMDECPVECN